MPLNPPQGYLKLKNIHRTGLAAARPAASNVVAGTLYFSSDLFTLERSNGVTWDSYGGGGGIGPTGPVGPSGINGVPGFDGLDGTNGLDGINGKDGVIGTNGSIGPQGLQGYNGLDGIDGENGLDGLPGPMGPAGINGSSGASGLIRKTSDQGVTNSTTLVDITDIQIPVNANKTYLFEFYLMITSDSNAQDILLSIIGPTGVSIHWAPLSNNSSAGRWIPPAVAGSPNGLFGVGDNISYGTAVVTSTLQGIMIVGIIRTAATAGTVILQFCQFTLTAGATVTIKENSLVQYREAT